MKPSLFTLMFTVLTLSSASAHNIWIKPTEQNPAEYVMKFGHTETITYNDKKLRSIQLLDSEGKLSPAPYQYKNDEAHFEPKGSSMVFMQLDNGIWSKLPSGKYVEKSKKEEPTAEFSVNPVKFGKAILKWDEQALKPHNIEYELVPQSVAEAGKPLPILVLQNGKPVQGIKVGLGEDQPFNLSDEKGIALFTPSQGFNKVWAGFEQKVENHPDYTERAIDYLLTFEAK